jgi:hypothetical protein
MDRELVAILVRLERIGTRFHVVHVGDEAEEDRKEKARLKAVEDTKKAEEDSKEKARLKAVRDAKKAEEDSKEKERLKADKDRKKANGKAESYRQANPKYLKPPVKEVYRLMTDEQINQAAKIFVVRKYRSMDPKDQPKAGAFYREVAAKAQELLKLQQEAHFLRAQGTEKDAKVNLETLIKKKRAALVATVLNENKAARAIESDYMKEVGAGFSRLDVRERQRAYELAAAEAARRVRNGEAPADGANAVETDALGKMMVAMVAHKHARAYAMLQLEDFDKKWNRKHKVTEESRVHGIVINEDGSASMGPAWNRWTVEEQSDYLEEHNLTAEQRKGRKQQEEWKYWSARNKHRKEEDWAADDEVWNEGYEDKSSFEAVLEELRIKAEAAREHERSTRRGTESENAELLRHLREFGTHEKYTDEEKKMTAEEKAEKKARNAAKEQKQREKNAPRRKEWADRYAKQEEYRQRTRK